jgi:hypothetical protein
MRSAMQEQQAGCVIELGDRAWTEDRFYVEDPVERGQGFPDARTARDPLWTRIS